VTAVHQLLASLSYGDAISNEALVVREHLRRRGYASDIFVHECEPRLRHETRPLSEYEPGAGAVCLFHFSIGSPASDLAYHARDRLVIRYHNITPAHWFARFHPHLARLCHHGRRELVAFSGRTTLALAASEFNRREMEEAGYTRTAVLPVVLDFAAYRRTPATPVIRRLYGPDRRNVVFVGRIIPSKRIEDLLRVFALFQRHVERRSRLLIVGESRGQEAYFARLTQMVSALRLRDVVFTGRVEDAERRAYYEAADVFLGLSEHEGFCVPLLEAMEYDVPVVAFDAGAVRETLGGAGVLLTDKSPPLVAELLGALLQNQTLRAGIRAGQRRVIDRWKALDFGALLMERLAPVLGPAPVRGDTESADKGARA
jgi:glycosyltransferase involved in cell wall biosynthesis